jgi:hypothetical protein
VGVVQVKAALRKLPACEQQLQLAVASCEVALQGASTRGSLSQRSTPASDGSLLGATAGVPAAPGDAEEMEQLAEVHKGLTMLLAHLDMQQDSTVVLP